MKSPLLEAAFTPENAEIAEMEEKDRLIACQNRISRCHCERLIGFSRGRQKKVNPKNRHCEERSDVAISYLSTISLFVSKRPTMLPSLLAMIVV